MKLSLCIATFNEAKNIHIPLESVIDLADEVIIVDGGSTDKTIDIARTYGDKVKVFAEKFEAMFHINKQKAIERAKGEWILQLDADEALSDELKIEIRKIVHRNFQIPISPSTSSGSRVKLRDNFQSSTKSQFPKKGGTSEINEVVAYTIPRKNWFLTRFLTKGGQYPDYTIRLYKNGVAQFPCKSVHENVKVNGNLGYLKSPILHYADPDFERYLTRWNRYTTLDVNLLIKKGTKINFFYYFFIKPVVWFLSTYIRHKGFMDGFPGLIFALFSSLRFWVVYIKWRTAVSTDSVAKRP